MSTFLTLLLLTSPLAVISSNLHTVLSPFAVSPSVEVFSSPVTKVETISLPTYTKTLSSQSASAVAFAGTNTPVVQRIESYSSGDSSNSEIRNLLRSLLSELRSSKSSAQTLSSSYGPPPSDSYGAPPPSEPSDSYGAPPKNTYSDPSAPSYPDSARKPEKVVVLQQQRQPAAYVTAPAAAAVATIQTRAPEVKEVVRTVYQPVYVPVQYSQPQVQYQLAQPVRSVPTGVSAVAYSTVHNSPAYAIQQQYSLPTVVQQDVQQVVTLQSTGTTAAVLEGSSSGGYKK